MKTINWQKVQQKSKKVLAFVLVQIILFGGIILNSGQAIANPLTPEANSYQTKTVDNGQETRSVPEQAKNAIDSGFSVFKKATDNSLEKLNTKDSPSGDAKKFYDPIEGREAIDREGGR